MNIHNNNADFSLVAEDLTIWDTSFATCKTKMTLPTVDPLLLKRSVKMGRKTETFTRRALDLAKQNIDLLPRGIDLAAIDRDMLTREQLLSRYVMVEQLAQSMLAAANLLGSDLYSAGLAAYNAMKANSRDAGLRALLKDLGETFARKSSEDDDEEGTTPGATA
jgi:hypothetical protein